MEDHVGDARPPRSLAKRIRGRGKERRGKLDLINKRSVVEISGIVLSYLKIKENHTQLLLCLT
jgi:hypothetical protein